MSKPEKDYYGAASKKKYSGFGGYRGHQHGACLGGKRTPEYESWNRMIQRCCNPKHPSFHRYGGRGIGIYPAWRHSFKTFLKDVGSKPGKEFSLDRINNNGNYEPGNVRWATPKIQGRNTRKNRILVHNGISMCISEWAEKLGIKTNSMCKRLKFARDPFRERLAIRTHCRRGHEFTPDNIIQVSATVRTCRTCRNRVQKKYRDKIKG